MSEFVFTQSTSTQLEGLVLDGLNLHDGTTYQDVGEIAGMFFLDWREYIRITYTAVPTVRIARTR